MKVVLCNCPPHSSSELAQQLVEKRLAACVNIVSGVSSVYRWEGELVVDAEHTLIIKVAESRLSDLRDGVLVLHPYSVPEFVVLNVDIPASGESYVAWVRSMCTAD